MSVVSVWRLYRQWPNCVLVRALVFAKAIITGGGHAVHLHAQCWSSANYNIRCSTQLESIPNGLFNIAVIKVRLLSISQMVAIILMVVSLGLDWHEHYRTDCPFCSACLCGSAVLIYMSTAFPQTD